MGSIVYFDIDILFLGFFTPDFCSAVYCSCKLTKAPIDYYILCF